MIGYLQGILLSRSDPLIIINVSGVGYKVFASMDILQAYHVGDTVTVFVHTHVREDALELYGFIDESSLTLFELLLGVSGIGPKTALGIFSLGKREDIVYAIQKADVTFFTGAVRLGKTNAQKIIIELKNKIGAIEEIDLTERSDDAMQALLAFGFRREEIQKVLREIGKEGTTEEKIKRALKYLGK